MKVVVHDDKFHADEVFAVAILNLIYPDLEVVRSRDPGVLKEADLKVDIGMKYNPEKGDFDHHQSSFNEERDNGIPYASAGLIWRNFGKQLCDEDVFEDIDNKLIQAIDAYDCGIDICPNPVYRAYDISNFIDSFNCFDTAGKDQDISFRNAVKLAKETVLREIKRSAEKFRHAEFIRSKIKESNGDYLVLDKYYKYKDFVIKESNIKFVIFPDSKGNNWLVVAVPERIGSFKSRADFPESWGGKEVKELIEISGVEDAVFCHKNLFIAVAKSRKGAIKLAELALKNKDF